MGVKIEKNIKLPIIGSYRAPSDLCDSRNMEAFMLTGCMIVLDSMPIYYLILDLDFKFLIDFILFNILIINTI